MGRKPIKFVKAKRNFNSVHYYPFGNEPAEPYVLTSDPWNYLKAHLKNEHDSIRKKTAKLGPRKERLGKAIYFINLAESFLKSTNNVKCLRKAL